MAHSGKQNKSKLSSARDHTKEMKTVKFGFQYKTLCWRLFPFFCLVPVLASEFDKKILRVKDHDLLRNGRKPPQGIETQNVIAVQNYIT